MNVVKTIDPIEKLEGAMLQLEQVDTPLTHRFAPGVYLREIFMPADTIVIGHKHKTKHFNIILEGSAQVMMDGEMYHLGPGCTFTSEPGVRKVLHVLEDMRWQTVHPTDEVEIETLEDMLIEKSETWLEREKELIEAEMKQLGVMV